MAKTRRSYTGASVSTTTSSAIAASGTTTFTVSAATNWPYGADPFYVVLSPGTASEEKVLVSRANTGDTTLNISSDAVRGLDGTSAVSHDTGATVYPVFTAVDADEANELASMWEAKGDIVSHGAATFARLPVGADNRILTADSSAASGLAWDDTLSITSVTAGSATVSGAVNAGSAAVTNAVTAGSATVTGDLTVDTNTLLVDSTNNWVGVGRTPILPLDVEGRGRFVSPNVGSTGAVVIRQPASDVDGGYIQFTNNAGSAQTGSVYVSNGGSMVLNPGSSGVINLAGTTIQKNSTAFYGLAVAQTTVSASGTLTWHLISMPSGVSIYNLVAFHPVAAVNNVLSIEGYRLGVWSGQQTATQIYILCALGNSVHLDPFNIDFYYRV
jgi:hypothetical protein